MSPFGDTGVPPQEAFLGMKTRLILDKLVNLGNPEATLIHNNLPHCSEKKEALNERIREKKRVEAERNIRNYHRPGAEAKCEYAPGDWVLLKNANHKGLGKPRYQGPYQVIATPQPAVCVIRRKVWSVYRDSQINVKLLKRYHWREPMTDVAAVYFGTPLTLAIRKRAERWTVISQTNTPKGTILGRYQGELLDEKQYQDRYTGDADAGKQAELLKLSIEGDKYYLDQGDPMRSNWTRFIRDDCDEPNVELNETNAKLEIRTLCDL